MIAVDNLGGPNNLFSTENSLCVAYQMFIKKMLGASCNLCLTIRCSFKIFFMLGAHGNLRLTIRWSSRVFFFILVAHGNLCLAIRWSLKMHWYVGCPWQPMPGLHFARFCFKLPQQILLISEQLAGDKTTNNWVQCKPAGH